MYRSGAHRPGRMLWILLALVTSACSDVSTLRERAPSQTGFPGALAKEYLSYAESEQEQGHWRSSQRQAARGLEACEGKLPAPASPDKDSLHDDDYRMLSDARLRLSDRLAGPIPADIEDELARAQLLYECWLTQVAEQRQTAAEAACGSEFEATMATIEREQPARKNQAMGRASWVMLSFAASQSQLSDAATARLANMAKKASKMADFRIYVTGYADAAGAEEANRSLARERAVHTRDALVALGIQPEKIIVRSGGILAPVELEGSTSAGQPLRRAEVALYRVGAP